MEARPGLRQVARFLRVSQCRAHIIFCLHPWLAELSQGHILERVIKKAMVISTLDRLTHNESFSSKVLGPEVVFVPK